MPVVCQKCLQPTTELYACGDQQFCEMCKNQTLQAKKKVKREEKKRDKKEAKKLTGKSELRLLKNEAFTHYYESQLPFLREGEWAEVEQCLRTPLPVTWRFSGHDESALALRAAMESEMLPQLTVQPTPLAWYPSRLGWRFDVSRAQLRGKDWEGADAPDGAGRSDAVKALHSYLVRETDLGRIQRQEAVSMVPPLLLNIQPGMSVCDMCASPGSKSQQIVEMLAVAAGEAGGAAAAEARGLLIANDADIKRCHLLASRAGKLNSPSLVVTNHDARLFPETLAGEAKGTGPTPEGAGDGEGGGVPLRFDRVLADVPCSGDGTLRKNPLIWRRWCAGPGNMLNSLQYQIACKGVRLTKVGGRFVYSTCSMNPIENEAVVSRLLSTFGDKCIRLVDVSNELPSLKRREGVSTWKVWHRGQWHQDWASVVERFPTKCPKLESLFPPTSQAASTMHLERCVRLMPHDVDGSGFFIAVFDKVGEHDENAGTLDAGDTKEICVVEGAAIVPQELSTNADGEAKADKAGGSSAGDGAAAAEEDEVVAEEQDAAMADEDAAVDVTDKDKDTPELGKARIAEGCAKMEVLHALGGNTAEAAMLTALSSYAPLFKPPDELLKAITQSYGLSAGFPLHRLVVRSPQARSLLLLADEVLSLLRSDRYGALKVVNTGVRVFEREVAKGVLNEYRLCQDGLSHTLPALGKQLCQCTVEAAVRVLTCKTPPNKQVSAAEMESEEPRTAKELKESCQPGSVVLVCTSPLDGLQVCVCVLYAPSGAVGAMVKGLERQALLFRLGVGGGG